jgi:hypothetical protein
MFSPSVQGAATAPIQFVSSMRVSPLYTKPLVPLGENLWIRRPNGSYWKLSGTAGDWPADQRRLAALILTRGQFNSDAMSLRVMLCFLNRL